MNIYATNDDISSFKNKILKKIEEYQYLISYAFAIKKCYDLCTNLERYNHQAIANLYELFKKKDDFFIQKKYDEINKYLFILKQTEFKPEIKGIKLKEQIIKNNTNNIKMIQEEKDSNEK